MWFAKPLNTDDVSRKISVGGRDVTLASQTPGQALSEAQWVILGAQGFASEEMAREFGEQLKAVAELAGLCSRLGVDVGDDKPTSWVNENFARSSGLIKPTDRLIPNIHGLTIMPDDDRTRIPVIQAEGKVLADPDQFLGALNELTAQAPIQLATAAEGVRVLNLALINPQPLAQVALAISVIEALGQDEEWSVNQAALIEALSAQAEASAEGQDPECLEVAQAMRRELHRVGLRQGVLRVLAKLGLGHLNKDWDRIYGLRSGLFHGTRRLPESEIRELATETLSLCGRIVLALAETEGARLPAISFVHFPDG
jgi:hypothetical protein